MNILVIGQNTKLAAPLSTISDKLFMVVDTSIANYRSYSENSSFNILTSNTDVTNLANVIKRRNEINAWVRKYDIDIIYTNEKVSMIAAKLSSLFAYKRVKLLSTSHNSYAWLHPKKVSFFSRLVNWATDGYVCLATFVYNQLLYNKVPAHKLLLHPNTIEYELFTPKKKYNIENGIVKIVYTSVVYEGKAQSDVIKAAILLKERKVNFQIDFYGNTISKGEGYYNYCNRLIYEHDLSENISFKGLIENSDLRKLLPSYDIYVCPSHMEMSPFNILEAKASGLPIIATNVGGISDLIKNENDGLLIEASNPGLIANSIMNLINNESKREQLGRNARISVITAADSASEEYMTFINSL